LYGSEWVKNNVVVEGWVLPVNEFSLYIGEVIDDIIEVIQ